MLTCNIWGLMYLNQCTHELGYGRDSQFGTYYPYNTHTLMSIVQHVRHIRTLEALRNVADAYMARMSAYAWRTLQASMHTTWAVDNDHREHTVMISGLTATIKIFGLISINIIFWIIFRLLPPVCIVYVPWLLHGLRTHERQHIEATHAILIKQALETVWSTRPAGSMVLNKICPRWSSGTIWWAGS